MLCFKSSSRKPLSFLQAGNLVNGDSFRHSRRNLDFFVLLAGIEGSLYISQDDVHYTLGPGEFMLLMPGHVHEGYRSSEGRLSYFWCHFRAGDDYQLVDESGVKQYLENLERSGLPKDIYLLPEHGVFANTNRISLEFRQLIDFSMQKPYSNAILDYAASLLALDLTQEYLQQNEKHTVMTRSFCSMIDLQEYIRLHYQEELSVPKLAEQFGYHSNYLSTAYKRATGESLIHYINQTRIAAAKTLLLDTKDSIAAISSRVGYNDSKYFIRIFRQMTGMTPAMFRNVYFRKYINWE